MYPSIHLGSLTIYSFGLMLVVGAHVALYFFLRELKRKGLGSGLGIALTIVVAVAGLVGARLLSLLENWTAFLADPLHQALSAGGLSFNGGLLLAIGAVYVYLRRRRISFLPVMDALAPSLLIGYGIARIGCHLAGDGDYGFPTSLPWATDYAQGVVPPSLALRNFPEITRLYSGGVVPDHTLCHPTPIYEFLICSVLFAMLWGLRKRIQPAGGLLMLYFVCAGLERFCIEFLRLNSRIAFGLTEAQIISAMMIIAGAFGLYAFFGRTLRTHEASKGEVL